MSYQKLSLTWRDIDFTLNFDPAYIGLNDVAHIEIRCSEPLPITETGYKSIFITSQDITDIRFAAALVMDSMEREAKKKKWHVDKQLSLF